MSHSHPQLRINGELREHQPARPAVKHKLKSKSPTKARFSDSPLARPEGIYVLASQFQQRLHFPDPGPLYALMGAVAGNFLTGQPVWIMLVAGSGWGKTELLRSLEDVAQREVRGRMVKSMRLVSSIKGEAALLSGVKRKEMSGEAKGGLLMELGSSGGMVIFDFTTILSMNQERIQEVLAALREIHDGHWSRDVGTEGGKHLEWNGKIGLFGGCTHAIDRSHSIMSSMGERLIFYRIEESEGWGEANAALHNTDVDAMREELRALVEAFFHGLGLSWDRTERRELRQSECNRLIGLAQFASKARAGVVRDFRQREIVDVPTSEGPQKLAGTLQQLYLGMEAVGLEEADRWKVVRKVAFDCMPLTRSAALKAILARRVVNGNGKGDVEMATMAQIGEYMRVSQTTVRRTLEDLAVHGVVEKVKGKTDVGTTREEDGEEENPNSGGTSKWRLTKWARERLRAAER